MPASNAARGRAAALAAAGRSHKVMPTYVTCQSCGGKLRIPDEYLGQKVRCPACTFTFEAVASPPSSPPSASETPASQPPPGSPFPNLSLEDEPPGSSPPPPTPEAVTPTAEETGRPLSSPSARLKPCPYCGESVRPEVTRCPHCNEPLDEEPDEEDEDERPWEGRAKPGVRRDCEPHRGGLIQVLGIMSVSLVPFLCCYPLIFILSPVGLGLAIPAWVMGRGDLAKMRQGLKDPEGRGHTQAGMICGIVGTTLHSLAMLVLVAIVVFYIIILMSLR